MIPVSDLLKEAVKSSHQMAAKVEMWVAGAWMEIPYESGSVSADYDSLVHRTCDIDLAPDHSTNSSRTRLDSYAPTIYGSYVRVSRGVVFPSGASELVPQGVFIIESFDRDDGANYGITLHGSDLFAQINRARLEEPREVSGPSRIEICKALVSEALNPNLPWGNVTFRVADGATDSSLAATVIERDRGKAIQDILEGAGMRGYFAVDGAFVFAPVVTPSTKPSGWSVVSGHNGTLVKVRESLSRDKTYNIVVVNGEPPDEATPPVRHVSRDEDVNSPTYWLGGFGKVPHFYSSQFIYTAAQAKIVADAMLLKVRGSASSFDVDTVPAPFLEPGDPITILHTAETKLDTHLILSTKVALNPGPAMSMSTQLLSTVPTTSLMSASAWVGSGMR